jgi:tetratricopeptide (TPR) repeat protein
MSGARNASEAALAAAPDSPGLLWNLALLSEREGNAEETERHFAKLVSLKPDFEDAAYRLGFLQLQRGDYAAAVDSFEICIKQRADWVEALLNLGLACWKFQDLDSAAQTFERVLSLQAQNADALRALIAIAIERKDHARAWDLQQKLVAVGPPTVELSYNLGLLLQAAGEAEKAAQCYQWASEAQPDFRAALTNLGHALKATGKDEEARAAWSKAIEVDPELAAKYFQ